MSEERDVYRNALLGVGIAMAAILAVGVAVSWMLDGPGGAVAAAVGGGVAAIAGLATPASMLIARERPATLFGALVLGAWLAKMIVILVVVAVLTDVEGFHRAAFGWTLMAGVLASLAVDVWAVRSGRVPYVTPYSKSPSE
jgi:hypothetical protein